MITNKLFYIIILIVIILLFIISCATTDDYIKEYREEGERRWEEIEKESKELEDKDSFYWEKIK